jgi:hypothetical protein
MQTPPGFQIYPLQEDIYSWLSSIIDLQRSYKPGKSTPLPHPEPESGKDGIGIWAKSVWDQTHSLTISISSSNEQLQEDTSVIQQGSLLQTQVQKKL